MISVLCARPDSVYKNIPGLDVYDKERDMRNFNGNNPIIAHPPCRAYGRLRHFANPEKGERQLSVKCLRHIRNNGGVLEHPYSSILWKKCNLPNNGKTDKYGGITLVIDQHWFGHKAKKSTKLYIVGLTYNDLPEIPMDLDYPEYVVARHSNSQHNKEITKSEREHTPIMLANFLIETVDRIKKCQ